MMTFLLILLTSVSILATVLGLLLLRKRIVAAAASQADMVPVQFASAPSIPPLYCDACGSTTLPVAGSTRWACEKCGKQFELTGEPAPRVAGERKPDDGLLRQVWFCPECGTAGMVVTEDKDVYGVAQKIRDEHRRAGQLRKGTLPACNADPRVLNEAFFKDSMLMLPFEDPEKR